MTGSSGGNSPQPRHFVERLLSYLVRRRSSGSYIVGDLREEYRGIVTRRGRCAADTWYCAQLLGIGGRTAFEELFLGRGQSVAGVVEDACFAFRSLKRRPLFTITAVVALGLGVAGTTTMFSVVSGVLLKDLPYRTPDTLVSLWKAVPEWRGVEGFDYLWDHMPFSWAESRSIREYSTTLSDVAVFRTTEAVLGGGGVRGSEMVSMGLASDNLFTLLGVQPMLGRSFTSDEVASTGTENAAVVILSHQVWARRFGSDPSVVGRAVDVNGKAHTVVGILAPQFRLSSDGFATFYTRGGVDEGLRGVWIPLSEGSGNELVARLAPGNSLEQARAEVQSLMGEETIGQEHAERIAQIARRRDFVTRGFGPPLLTLLGAAVTLLLVVCVSVAGLLIAEGATRAKEIAIRSALGACRWRVIRLLLIESTILGVFGAVVGAALAWLGTGTMLAVAPPIPRIEEIGVDLDVLLFAAAAGVGAGVLAGVLPARVIANPSISQVIGGRGQTSGHASRSLQHRVLTVQVALTVLLLVAGGLFARSVHRLMSVETGFDPHGMLTLDVLLPPSNGPGADRRVDYSRLWGEVLLAAERAPGIQSVSATTFAPFAGLAGNDYFSFLRGGERVDVTIAASRRVWPNYHEMMGIRLVQGRRLMESAGSDEPAGMLVSASLAEQIWPDGSAIGTTVDYYGNSMTIVGVVEDVRKKALGSPPEPVFYYSLDRLPTISVMLTARVSGDQEGAVASLRAAILSVNADITLTPAKTMLSLMRQSEADDRFRALLVVTFASFATLMAALGVFGVTARGIAARVRELGIRKALGATDTVLIRFVVNRSVRSGLVGGAAGLLASLAVTRVIAHFLYGVKSYDPVTYLAVSALLTLVTVAAAYLPARRIASLAPMEAITEE